MINGILLINKKRGLNSTAVGSWVKRQFNRQERPRVGHLGTLDPLAEGLLPILLGPSTRLSDVLQTMPKTYRFEVTFGFATDTLDLGGEVCARQEIKSFSDEQLSEVLKEFVGPQLQKPPLYSALKFEGRRLYELARSGAGTELDLEEKKRPITIYSLDLIERSDQKIVLEVSCSKGTYVRVLGQDIAAKLENLGTITFLERRDCAGFSIAEARSLDQLESLLASGQVCLADLIVPLKKISIPLPAVHLDRDAQVEKLKLGQRLSWPAQITSPLILSNPMKEPFAIGSWSNGFLKQERALS